MTVRMRLYRMNHKIQMWVAWKLPHWLVRWSAIRVAAYATTGKYGNTDAASLNAMEAVKRWEDKRAA